MRRAVWAIVLVLVLTLVTFVLFFVVPPDPNALRRGLQGDNSNIHAAFGLHGSLAAQYGEFVWNLFVHGSMGRSVATRQTVTGMIENAAPVTISVVVGGAIIFLLVGLVVGVASALRPRSAFDRTGTVLTLVGLSAHPAWIGLVLSYMIGFRWGLAPIQGYCDFASPQVGSGCNGPTDWAYHLVLPWLTFAIVYAALYSRMIRASVLAVYDADFVQTARAKGARERRVLRSHVLRNAMLPVVTMLGMDIGITFGGALFVEQVYGLPGLGRLAAASLRRHDLPPVVGVVVVVTTAIVILNALVDVLYCAIDPRVRVLRDTRLG